MAAFADSAEIDRHLVLVHRRHWQAARDWAEIAQRVRRVAPNIGVIIASDDRADPALSEMAAARPTLVMSPGQLHRFEVRRGRIYQGRNIAKLAQLRMLANAGVPVPRTTMLRPGLELDPAVWGPFVVLKPTDLASSSHGQGVQLMRTERVRFVRPDDWPEGHPGRKAPMMVQQFIDTGEQVSVYRVTTLMGEPLYCYQIRAMRPLPPRDADDATIEQTDIATQTIAEKTRPFVYEADVMAIARAAHAAIPDVPLKGCDIMREARTGRLHVLEVNPGGNTWHFSSAHLAAVRRQFGRAWAQTLRTQLDAFGTAALLLADLTLREAE